MENYNMVVRLPNFFPRGGIYKGCVLGKHHEEPFDFGKAWKA
jgi:hypothetical protein